MDDGGKYWWALWALWCAALHILSACTRELRLLTCGGKTDWLKYLNFKYNFFHWVESIEEYENL